VKALALVLAICGSATTGIAAQAQAQSPATGASPPAFARAYALQASGEYAAAADAYQRFLAEYPDNVEARSNLGVVLARLGRTDEAVSAYREALRRSPSQQSIRLNLGLALYKAARFDEAAVEFGQVVGDQPMNLQARYLEADCQLRLGRPDAVVASLEPISGSRGDDRVLLYLLGMAYLRTRQVPKGQVLIDRILRNGESAEAHLMLGMAKRAVQDLAGGLADLKRAVELNPELPSVHALYGQALLETGNRDLARREFEAELARNPSDFDANLFLGVLDKEEQRFDSARGHLSRALGVRPGDVGTRYQLAAIQVSLGETEQARETLERIVAEAPKFIEARVSLATVYYRLKLRELGDRERGVVEELNRELQARQPGAAAPPATPPR
jgi:tetratricopeptide (TPR) repeat protein